MPSLGLGKVCASMLPDLDTLALLVLASLAGGFVDAIAGGGGLITLPALLLAGLTPVEAVATNKLQGTFGVASASLSYWRAGHVDIRPLRPAILCTSLGAAAGALAVQALDPRWLAAIIPALLIAVAAYFALAERLDDRERAPRVGPVAFAAGAAAPIGFYDGFFGPGAGAFYTLAFVALAGARILPAIAGTKVLNLTSNLVSLVVFVLSGQVVYLLGLPMAAGQALGAWLGAHAAISHGARLIRPLIVVVCWAIALRLLLDPDNPALEWLGLSSSRAE